MTVVARIPKNRSKTLQVELTEFNGHQLVGVRVYAETNQGDPVPTRKGVTVKASLLPEIRKALAEAEEQARARGWIGGAHE